MATATDNNETALFDKARHIAQQIVTNNLEDAVGMIFLVGPPGDWTTANEKKTAEFIHKYRLSNFIFNTYHYINIHCDGKTIKHCPKDKLTFYRRIRDYHRILRQVVSNRQASSPWKVPALLAVDHESEIMTSFSALETIPTPLTPLTLAQTRQTNMLYAHGMLTGLLLHALDIDMLLGPVVDVDRSEYGHVYGARSFGYDTPSVRAAAIHYMAGLSSTGTLTTLKHYPGLSKTTSVNASETATPRQDSTESSSAYLLIDNHFASDIQLFTLAAQFGSAIMTSHVILKDMQPRGSHAPLVISPDHVDKFIHKTDNVIFSGQSLQGLGLPTTAIISDDLTGMAAATNYRTDLKYSDNARSATNDDSWLRLAYQYFKSGHDMLLLSHINSSASESKRTRHGEAFTVDDFDKIYNGFLRSFQTSPEARDRLTESVARILMLKMRRVASLRGFTTFNDVTVGTIEEVMKKGTFDETKPLRAGSLDRDLFRLLKGGDNPALRDTQSLPDLYRKTLRSAAVIVSDDNATDYNNSRRSKICIIYQKDIIRFENIASRAKSDPRFLVRDIKLPSITNKGALRQELFNNWFSGCEEAHIFVNNKDMFDVLDYDKQYLRQTIPKTIYILGNPKNAVEALFHSYGRVIFIGSLTEEAIEICLDIARGEITDLPTVGLLDGESAVRRPFTGTDLVSLKYVTSKLAQDILSEDAKERLSALSRLRELEKSIELLRNKQESIVSWIQRSMSKSDVSGVVGSSIFNSTKANTLFRLLSGIDGGGVKFVSNAQDGKFVIDEGSYERLRRNTESIDHQVLALAVTVAKESGAVVSAPLSGWPSSFLLAFVGFVMTLTGVTALFRGWVMVLSFKSRRVGRGTVKAVVREFDEKKWGAIVFRILTTVRPNVATLLVLVGGIACVGVGVLSNDFLYLKFVRWE